MQETQRLFLMEYTSSRFRNASPSQCKADFQVLLDEGPFGITLVTDPTPKSHRVDQRVFWVSSLEPACNQRLTC